MLDQDTERTALVETMTQDADALHQAGLAVADAMLAIHRTAVPLASQDSALAALLEALDAASGRAHELVCAIRSLAQRMDRNEVTKHEIAHIMARPYYLYRVGYALWTPATLALVPGHDAAAARSAQRHDR